MAARNCVIGAMNVLNTWASSTSRLGSVASTAIALSSNNWPFTTAAFTRGFSYCLAKSTSSLAGAISLTELNTMPVGPTR